MRRVVSLFIAFLLLFPCLTVYAAENVYRLDPLGLSVEIPSELTTFTRDTKMNDPNLRAFGLTKAQMDTMMAEGNIYLNALESNNAYEIVVTMQEIQLIDFFHLSNTELSAFASMLEENYVGSDIKFIKSEIYEHPPAKFIKIYIKQPNGAGTAYGLQYYTVYDGKAINFTIHSYSGPITDKKEALIKRVVDSIKFDITPQKKAPKETQPFIYTDTKSGMSFTVPANWEQGTLSKEREVIDVIFSSTQESGCSIMYGSIDIWAALSAEERRGYTRSSMNNSVFSKEDFAEISGNTAAQVETVMLSGKEYFKLTQETTTSVYGISVSMPTTMLMYVENGFAHYYYFYGDESSAQYTEFLEMVESANYGAVANDSEKIYTIAIIVILAVVFLVLIYIVKKKKHLEKVETAQNDALPLPHKESVTIAVSIPTSQTTEETLYCHMCGTQLPIGSDFCYKCGTKIAKE